MSHEQRRQREIKQQPNQDINVDDYVVYTQYSNFSDFFEYKKEQCGQPTFINMNNDLIFVGMEYSYIYVFQQDSDFKQGYKILGKESQSYRGQVKLIEISNDNLLLLVTYSNNEFVIFSLKSFKEILQHRYQQLKYAYMVPLQLSSDSLIKLRNDSYYEIIIHLENNYLFKVPLIIEQNTIKQDISIPIYKYGEPCVRQKIKENRHAKIFDQDYIAPNSTVIQDVQIMDTCYEEFIQCMDDRESTTSLGSNMESSPNKKKKNLFKQLFEKNHKKSDQIQEENSDHIISTQFYLMAVGFFNKIQVVKLFFGNKLNEEQSKIQVLLNFQRPDAYIYQLVFNQPQPQSQEAQELSVKCSCSWGLGSFKETNKRYVLLIVNWGCREYYAFKVMSSDYRVQVIQGGHFYTPVDIQNIAKIPLVCNFITNSVFFSFHSNVNNESKLTLMTTTQFEFGVPFTLQQIEMHYNQEKHIESISSGSYIPKFYHYTRDKGNQVVICQKVMESINDGFQNSNAVKINLKQLNPNLQIVYKNEQCYILNGTDLLSIRLKKWDELLYELSDSNEWEKCFRTAVAIHKGQLTILCNIPENDIQRHICIKDTCCGLALTYMILQLPNKQLRSNTSVLTIMHFLIKTQNEEYLFESIEDLMVGCGYRNIFYDYLRELLQQHQINIPYQHQLKVLKMFYEMGDKETCERLIMSIKNIQHFDPKGLIDFCLEKDFIEPMMFICSQINDFLTPYLRIITLITLLKNSQNTSDDNTITTLNYDQLKSYLFSFITFCFTGRNKNNPEQYFTDHQFKSMFKDVFEYLFDQDNISKLFEIDYIKTLEVFLLVFTERIQENFKQFTQEGKEINLQLSEVTQDGFLPEILYLENTEPHLITLSKIYVLIKLAEIQFYRKFTNAIDVDNHFQYSHAFSVNVFATCPLSFNINHIMSNLTKYMDILRQSPTSLFDISWVLQGKVQKDLPIEQVKNEFLHKVMLKIDRLLEGKQKSLEELRNKAKEQNWIWAEADCLIKLKKIPEALTLYLNNPDHLLSERVFTTLAVFMRSNNQLEFVHDWINQNIKLLASENSQKLFQLLYTYRKSEIYEVLRVMKSVGSVIVDQKIKNPRELNLFTGFIEYLQPRYSLDEGMMEKLK